MKNKKIKAIESRIKLTEMSRLDAAKPFQSEIERLTLELNAQWDNVFNADKTLTEALAKLEASQAFGLDESGLYSWVRFNVAEYKEADALEQLERFVSDLGYSIDVKNDALLNFQGGYIGINDEGDVYLDECGHTTWIIDNKDYETVAERNALIEAYMNKQGYFPGVFRVDNYGNVELINTQSKLKKA